MNGYVGFWPPTGAAVWLVGVTLLVLLPAAAALFRPEWRSAPIRLVYVACAVQAVGGVMMTDVVSRYLYG